VVGTHLDITERMQTQEAARTTRHELAATLQAVPDLPFDIGIDGVIHGQHSLREDLLLLLPAAQQIGRHVAEVVPPDAAAVVMQAVRLAHAGRRHRARLQQPPCRHPGQRRAGA
jgi:PAS domain-containing protein